MGEEYCEFAEENTGKNPLKIKFTNKVFTCNMPSVGNSNLQDRQGAMLEAKNRKDNEFYTRRVDIDKELQYYTSHFEDKIVYCNCDDPYESNFFKYFVENFYTLGLKELIITCYKTSPIACQELDTGQLFPKKQTKRVNGYKIELTEKEMKEIFGNTKTIKLSKIVKLLEDEREQNRYIKLLNGDGDFRSDECLELLKKSDIVVTNPPFALFIEYVNTIISYDKKFLIIGNQNAVSYKDIFQYIQQHKMWLGTRKMGNTMWFWKPNGEDYEKIIDGEKCRHMSAIWFTNLEHEKLYEPFNFIKTYKGNEKDYPKYDNYDAIEVSEVKNIPSDYKGVMGVPITFLSSYNEDEFEMLGMTQRGCHELVPDIKKYDDYKEIYNETNKPTGNSGGKTNENPNIIGRGSGKTFFRDDYGNEVYSCYQRVFIRRKDTTSLYPKEDKAELKRIEKEAENLAQNAISEEEKKEKKEIIIEQRLPLDNNLKKRILLRANYKCENEFCTKPRPFKKEDKTTYLEFHHIIPYCECRKHEYKNIVALCPNCHKQIHFGTKDEIEIMKNRLEKKLKKLK